MFVTLLEIHPVISQQQNVSNPAANEDYVIGLEDVLSINVYKDQDLSTKDVVVRPDGKISTPMAGDIQASGFTVKQLQESITEKLKEYITAPVVTVMVTHIQSKSVSVLGQVLKPAVYTIGSPTTVMELLARAGGLTADAKAKSIKIIRKEEGKTVTIPFNFNDMVSGRNLKQNIILRSGDIVVIP